jgi:hypothetical protein
LEASLDACKASELAGAGVWRWRKPESAGGDESYGAADPEVLRAWLARNAASGV